MLACTRVLECTRVPVHVYSSVVHVYRCTCTRVYTCTIPVPRYRYRYDDVPNPELYLILKGSMLLQYWYCNIAILECPRVLEYRYSSSVRTRVLILECMHVHVRVPPVPATLCHIAGKRKKKHHARQCCNTGIVSINVKTWTTWIASLWFYPTSSFKTNTVAGSSPKKLRLLYSKSIT